MAKQIAILGVGLIGGSLGLCFKSRTDAFVIGFDQSVDGIALAKERGAIDEGTTDLQQAVAEADLIFFAAPVLQIINLIEQLTQLKLKAGCILSDVGSTKAKIVEAGRKLFEKGCYFIGGHPMAGSHLSGVKAATSSLFVDANYILTPEPQTPLSALMELSWWLHHATEANLVIMDAQAHDRVMGAISHLPQLIASSLVCQVGEYQEKNESYFRLAAGGFRDTTRIAASDPEMWRDICLSNREIIVKYLDDFIARLTEVRTVLSQENNKWIEQFFTRSQYLRNQIR